MISTPRIAFFRSGAVVAACLATTAPAGAALAQAGGGAPAPSGGAANADAAVADIVVTAQHRETKLQETPVAISAVSGIAIQQQHIVDLRDVAVRVPSVTFDQASRGETFISIRGTTIGNDAAGIDQGVSVFIDDVPTTGFGDNTPDLYDLQSIEVLRGPQGTLFGRNVTGGAVLIHSRKPSFTSAGQATLTYGADNLAEAQLYATGPISKTIAGKVAFDFRRRDDYVTNTALNGQAGADRTLSVRGQLLWAPTDRFSLLVGADYLHDDSHDKIEYLLGNFQPSLLPPLTYGPGATNEGIRNRVGKRTGGAFARAEWSLPFASLTSITGYRNVRDSTHFSTSGDPYNAIISDPVVRDDQLSEELRLTSRSGQRFTWTTGIFVLHGHRAYLQTLNFAALPGSLLQTCCARFTHPFVNHQDQHVTVDSAAIYGEGSYAITKALKLTLGGRYSRESKSGHTEIYENSGTVPTDIRTGEYSHSWGSFTPKVLLSYQPRPTFLAYASVTNGFESGGYDTSGSDAASLSSAYSPETVWSYEGGVKTQWFDRRVTANISLYDAEYSNLQTRNFTALGTVIAGNAAKARVQGIETELQYSVGQGLTLGITYAYTKGRYLSYDSVDGNNSGHLIPNTPRHNLNLNASYHAANPFGTGIFRIGGDVTFRSKIEFNDANDTDRFVVDRSAYRGVTNLHTSWESDRDRLEVSLWVTNLTNTQAVINTANLAKFIATAAELNAGKAVDIANWSPSRVFGISLTAKY